MALHAWQVDLPGVMPQHRGKGPLARRGDVFCAAPRRRVAESDAFQVMMSVIYDSQRQLAPHRAGQAALRYGQRQFSAREAPPRRAVKTLSRYREAPRGPAPCVELMSYKQRLVGQNARHRVTKAHSCPPTPDSPPAAGVRREGSI
jgi:hypothetical protein